MGTNVIKAPVHLLTDPDGPDGADVHAWNAWRVTNADGTGVDFRDTYLRGTNLFGANLSGVDLRGADLWGANLCWVNFSGADLRRADMRDTKLSDANLTNTNLAGANLRSANLYGAYLSGADLTGANLSGAVGATRSDIAAAVPVGSGELCSAIRNADGTVTIWAGSETFPSIAACRERIAELGGKHEPDRLAWLAWVEARLSVRP